MKAEPITIRVVPLVICFAITCTSWSVAAVFWLSLRESAFAVSIFFLGLSLGPLLALYLLVPRIKKQKLRRMVLLAGGISILSLSLLGVMNLDLEGFFILLLSGTMGAAVGHTLITVIVGPMIFGRVLCGWGCWRSMILELLPIGRSPGRRKGAWHLLPLAGLGASLGTSIMAVVLFKHNPGGTPQSMHGGSIIAIVAGTGIYYAASVGLAFALKDQRAFCKYLCPSSVILRQSSRLSIVKMASDRSLCNDCGSCSTVCPMDIAVPEFVRAGRRITSGECILCQRCAHSCRTGALRLSLGFDLAGKTPYRDIA